MKNKNLLFKYLLAQVVSFAKKILSVLKNENNCENLLKTFGLLQRIGAKKGNSKFYKNRHLGLILTNIWMKKGEISNLEQFGWPSSFGLRAKPSAATMS